MSLISYQSLNRAREEVKNENHPNLTLEIMKSSPDLKVWSHKGFNKKKWFTENIYSLYGPKHHIVEQ